MVCDSEKRGKRKRWIQRQKDKKCVREKEKNINDNSNTATHVLSVLACLVLAPRQCMHFVKIKLEQGKKGFGNSLQVKTAHKTKKEEIHLNQEKLLTPKNANMSI